MFIPRIIRSILNLVLLVAALASMGTIGSLTYEMAIDAGKASKQGFLSIAKLNQQLLSE